MAKNPDDQRPSEPPEYRVYRSGSNDRPKAQTPAARGASGRKAQPPRKNANPKSDDADDWMDDWPQASPGARGGAGQRSGTDQRSAPRQRKGGDQDRPYQTYRSTPRGLLPRLRGESDPDLELDRAAAHRSRERRPKGSWWRTWTWRRALKYLVVGVVGWLALSFVLFMISAAQAPGIPASAAAQLTPGGNMVTSANTILILGIDQRPRTGPGSKEPGADYNVAGSNSDTIMLWRVGGGVSRRLSIPRDTVADIPGHGYAKINDGFALGGPALAIKTIKQFTGLQINHVIIVNLAAFPPFINAIGGIDIKTGKVCANISGGTAVGGFTLDLNPGVHHLNGLQALLYSRIRENPCNPSDSDLTREIHQQQILNAIRSQLVSPSTFFRLPWASWAAPKVLQTDMGGLTMMSLFLASEMGGSAAPKRLPTSGAYDPSLGDVEQATPGAVRSAVNQLMNG